MDSCYTHFKILKIIFLSNLDLLKVKVFIKSNDILIAVFNTDRKFVVDRSSIINHSRVKKLLSSWISNM
ncbi:protein of unknown function [Candidatus Nitrosocosmicus franklandus]|uniref:Uncharacterized protein n=1 Tax=Candidatus Nitrosocosmicus franklandianus TaxID=1798806 RepID=A0A484I782_9ARCH|nr:protein of unknown function [Candidatus Nitrosocosmicus franklandus]